MEVSEPHHVTMPKDIRLRLAKRLRALREKHRFTQDQLSRKAGISTKYLQNLEGKRPKKATIVTLEKLAKGFGISVSELCNFW